MATVAMDPDGRTYTIELAPIVIVIVNSRFLEHPQKRSRGNQLIHMRLTVTKSIGSGQNPKSQVGRPTVRRLCAGWCSELRRGGRYGEEDEAG